MSLEKKKRCPICTKEIELSESTTICPQCHVVHHASCWEKNNGCCTQGCIASGTNVRTLESIAAMQHSNPAKGKSVQHSAPSRTVARTQAPVNQRIEPAASKQIVTKTKKDQNYSETVSLLSNPTESYSHGTGKVYVGDPSSTYYPNDSVPTAYPAPSTTRSRFCGYDDQGRMDEFMQSLIQDNTFYYDQKFSLMNNSGKNASWNWPCSLFGIYWFLYRRMYKNALLLLLISFAVSLTALIPIAGIFISFILGLTLWILTSLFANSLYKNHIETLYVEFSNLSYDQRKQQCITKGGTSVFAPIIYIAVQFLLSLILFGLLLSLGLSIGLSI